MSTVTNELSPTPGGIGAIPLPRRARGVEAWSRVAAPHPAGPRIHQLFQAQPARTPGAAAGPPAGSTGPLREVRP